MMRAVVDEGGTPWSRKMPLHNNASQYKTRESALVSYKKNLMPDKVIKGIDCTPAAAPT